MVRAAPAAATVTGNGAVIDVLALAGVTTFVSPQGREYSRRSTSR